MICSNDFEVASSNRTSSKYKQLVYCQGKLKRFERRLYVRGQHKYTDFFLCFSLTKGLRSKCYTLRSISTVYRFTFYISICISILPIHSIEIQISTCISFFDYMHGSVVESMLYTVITVQHFYWGIKFCLCLFMFILPI